MKLFCLVLLFLCLHSSCATTTTINVPKPKLSFSASIKKIFPLNVFSKSIAVRSSNSNASYTHELVITGLFGILATTVSVTVPIFTSRVFAKLIAPKVIVKDVFNSLSYLLVCHTLEPIMTFMYVNKCSDIINKYISNLQNDVFNKIIHQDVSYFDNNRPESITQLVSTDIDKIRTLAMQNLSRDRGFRSLLEIICGISILFKLNWQMGILFTVFTPLLALNAYRIGSSLIKVSITEANKATILNSATYEIISNFKEVFTFCNQNFESSRFRTFQSNVRDASLSTGKAKALFEAVNRAAIYSIILLMFSVGSVFVSKEMLSPSMLISFIGYCFNLNFAMQGALYSLGDFTTASVLMKKINEFLAITKKTIPPICNSDVPAHTSMPSTGFINYYSATDSTITSSATTSPDELDQPLHSVTTATTTVPSLLDQSTVPPPPPPSSSIPAVTCESLTPNFALILSNVSFSYPSRPDIMILNGISLQIPAGQVTALVGPSGSGKSTLASMLCRFYEPTEGMLTVDGIDYSRIPTDAYLKHVSIVRQSPAIFSGTLADNIAYGARSFRDVTPQEIEVAARAANAHDFISKLPEGYQTLVGNEKGAVQLSGGQRQRIAIARAILKDARLLVLDEATSALDTESEALVQDALQKLMKGRTTVVIAHRLNTIIDADQICVIVNGKLEESGNHSSLIASKGFYYSMYNTKQLETSTSVNAFISQ